MSKKKVKYKPQHEYWKGIDNEGDYTGSFIQQKKDLIIGVLYISGGSFLLFVFFVPFYLFPNLFAPYIIFSNSIVDYNDIILNIICAVLIGGIGLLFVLVGIKLVILFNKNKR